MHFYKKYNYVVEVPDIFNNEEISRIHQIASRMDRPKGVVGMNDPATSTATFGFKPDVRDSDVSWFRADDPNNRWIFERVNNMVRAANENFFHFDIAGQEDLQYGRYVPPGGKYTSHSDTSLNPVMNRKISWSIQLTDPQHYEGGELLIYDTSIERPFVASRKKGTATLFLSLTLHEVKPVTRGERVSMVSWVSGPPFK